jgi:ABC-type multidrug transport system fused ATPase/permease subunit
VWLDDACFSRGTVISAPAAVTEQGAEVREHLSFKRVVNLVWRCWPYYRPQLKHIALYLALNAFVGVVILGSSLVGNDLMYNKVLNAEPLSSLQASYLFLDDSYVAADGEDLTLDEDQRRGVLYRLLVGVLIYGVLVAASFLGTGTYMAWIYQRINQDLRMTMVKKLEGLSLQYHAFARTGDAIYRVYQDSATITNVLQMFVITPLRAIGWVLFGALVLTLFSPWLGFAIVVTATPMTWLVWKLTPRVRHHARRARETNSALTSNIQEAFAAIKIVKANQAEAQILDEFDRDSTAALDYAFRFRVDIILLTAAMLLGTVGMLIVAEYWMASWAIAEKATYLGGVFTFVGFAAWNLGAFQSASGAFGNMNGSAIDMVALWVMGLDLSVGLDRAFYLLELEPGVAEADNPSDFPLPVSRVSWNDVHFAYEDEPVIQDLSLEARAGTVTAIVGSTGSGKSTLMSLLLRLYDPQEGEIRINDTPINELALDDLRGHVAIALQKNVLFTATIRENIAYADDRASDESVEDAARIACADEFIRDLPDGYLTELGERGSKLSTGQRQRLSIARAIVRDTPILILDEPTAALDAKTEQQVLANLREWSAAKSADDPGRVVFLITHRLSTVKTADQIAFLEDGRIAEIGSHAELMTIEGGRYRAFVEAELMGTSHE